jgi:hypothetical protein
MGYISKKKKPVADGENVHPYMKGYIFWRNSQFWENRNDMTETGKEYFRESLNRMSKVYNLTKVDDKLQ